MFYFFRLNEKRVCTYISKEYEKFWNQWYWIDLFAYSCLPFVAIAYCNCSILYKVIMGQIRRKKLQNPGGKKDGSSAQLTSMTYMLTTVSVMFILLTLPSSIFFIVDGQLVITTWKQSVQSSLLHAVTNLLGYVNNVINFLLYCVSGTQFRREVYRMFRGLRRGEFTRSSTYNASRTFSQTLED
jgi:hypothetical protein